MDPGSATTGGDIELAGLKVAGLAIDGDTVWVASVRDRLVARVDREATRAVVALAYPHAVADVAPSPAGLWLVAGGGTAGRQCVLWSLAAAHELRRFDCPGGAGGGLALHAGRLWLTHRHDRRLLVLDPASGTVEREIAMEHEVFSPSVAAGALWVVESATGPFGRFSPQSAARYFFTRLDPADGRPVERLSAPPVAAMATDGVSFWLAPRDAAGVQRVERAELRGS